jgi:hypothetical protein
MPSTMTNWRSCSAARGCDAAQQLTTLFHD